ncbi:MAG: hypothetical protein KDE27_26610, partial [Planctomycetes bacterium]|nr:hypothetical protein [Planctomycetota bacterium]
APLLAAVGSARRLELALAVAPAADGAENVVRLTAAVDGSAHGTRWAGLLTAAGDARLPSAPPGSVAQIAFGRSVGALLRAPAEYLGSGEQLALQSFLSIADAIDGPQTSFTADLVGGLAEPWVLTVLGPVAGEGPHSPLVLPRFALSAGIADAEVETVLRRAAQVFAVIANGQRAQQRKLPFVVRNARTAHGRGLVAEPPVWRGPGLPPVEDALTPALLFGAGHAVLASTLDAAEAVLAALAQGRPAPGGGDHIRIDGGAVASALAANRGPLELGRMLDEGDSASEAARFVDIVLAVAAATARLELAIDYGDGATTLRLELERRR